MFLKIGFKYSRVSKTTTQVFLSHQPRILQKKCKISGLMSYKIAKKSQFLVRKNIFF